MCQSFITVHVMRQLFVLVGLQKCHVCIMWLVEDMKRLLDTVLALMAVSTRHIRIWPHWSLYSAWHPSPSRPSSHTWSSSGCNPDYDDLSIIRTQGTSSQKYRWHLQSQQCFVGPNPRRPKRVFQLFPYLLVPICLTLASTSTHSQHSHEGPAYSPAK